MKNKLFLSLIGIVLLSGCVVNIQTSRGFDGGFYLSPDRGETWTQKTLLYKTDNLEKTFNQVDVSVMMVDPTDSQAIYLGTEQNGLLYTYNQGDAWLSTLTGLGRINAVVVDPKDRCTLYVAIGNQVYKTNDCSRHWSKTLMDTRTNPVNTINGLAIDPQNSQQIYGITSGGTLFKSLDNGVSWQSVKFFGNNLVKILVNPNNSKIIYIVTSNQGIFRTADGGLNWNDITTGEQMKPWANATVYRNLIFDPTQNDALIYASQYGLLKSDNGGATWNAFKLLTPPGTTVIYGLAVNPKNNKEIYYGIGAALYRTLDGGANWTPRSLPSGRAAFFINLNPDNPAQLYLGVHTVSVNSTNYL